MKAIRSVQTMAQFFYLQLLGFSRIDPVVYAALAVLVCNEVRR